MSVVDVGARGAERVDEEETGACAGCGLWQLVTRMHVSVVDVGARSAERLDEVFAQVPNQELVAMGYTKKVSGCGPNSAGSLRSESETERKPEVPACPRGEALFRCARPSGVRAAPGKSGLHAHGEG